MGTPTRFNIRVYGIWTQNDHVLLCREHSSDMAFTKFPGGGLELGEGTEDCIRREFREELDCDTGPLKLYYINGHYQPSAFNPSDQVITIYYKVDPEYLPGRMNHMETRWGKQWHLEFYWRAIQELQTGELTFPIDKIVAEKIVQDFAALTGAK
ncbi:MAG: NUDIX domain-containing protein [Bacteroidetes bacterium]|nr:NUDIX domain-containing protein [Bacteroidota bacterium]